MITVSFHTMVYCETDILLQPYWTARERSRRHSHPTPKVRTMRCSLKFCQSTVSNVKELTFTPSIYCVTFPLTCVVAKISEDFCWLLTHVRLLLLGQDV